MVWALVLVAVALLGAFAVMRRKPPAADADARKPEADGDDDEPDTPPITDAPRVPARPKQILTPTGATQPLPKPAESEAPANPSAPLAKPSAPRLPSSIPLDDPLGDLELGAPGTGPKLDTGVPRSKYHAPEVVFDPSTPSIALADEPRAKTPTAQPVAAAPATAPLPARTRSATIPPVVRAKAPTIPPQQQAAAESGLSMRTKRPSSSPPLMEGGVVVRMKPPTNPPPMTTDAAAKKGTPGQGVVIRAKPPTSPPLVDRRGTPGTGVPTGRSKTPGSVPVIAPPEVPEVVPPAALANKLRYATLSATISHVGIDAKREDGIAKKVMWPDVVGIVARRLPPDEPYAGETFIDIVSTAGATLRILPWTHLAGDRIDGEGIERARTFVQLAAARCPGAKLDAATRTFLGSHGQAAQLPDEPTLAAHDKRLS